MSAVEKFHLSWPAKRLTAVYSLYTLTLTWSLRLSWMHRVFKKKKKNTVTAYQQQPQPAVLTKHKQPILWIPSSDTVIKLLKESVANSSFYQCKQDPSVENHYQFKASNSQFQGHPRKNKKCSQKMKPMPEFIESLQHQQIIAMKQHSDILL